MRSMTRRNLALAAISAAGIAGTSRRSARASDDRRMPAPGNDLRDIVRILGRTDGEVAIRWTKGVLSGVVDQRTTQLLGVSQQIFTRHRPTGDGGFDAVYLEIVYFTDLSTGKVPDTWTNIYTGRAVAVPTQVLGPTRLKIPPSLRVINAPFAMDGIENAHWFEPLQFNGGDVSFDERIDSFVPPMIEGGAPMIFHEVFSFQASRADLSNAAAPFVPATVHKVNVISWRNWMDMHDVAGVTMSHGSGRVVRDLEDIPSDLAAKNRLYFPDIVANVGDYLDF